MINRTEQEIMKNWRGDIKSPTVSICTITYNHENFIEEALDSFLMQETDFPIEIVIDDDCSIDKTPDIIRKYVEKFPNIIKANLREQNVGMMSNFIENLNRAKGKYIALCEGDDYWTDPLKLQKQIGFLEENNEYILVSANTKIAYEKDGFVKKEIHKNFSRDFDFSVKELMVLDTSPVATLTASFRNIVKDYSKIPFERYWAGDKQLWMYLMQFGKGRYMNQIFGVYRKHTGGVTSNLKKDRTSKILHIRNRMNNHEEWNKFYTNKYNDEIEALRHKEYFALSILYLKGFEIKEAIYSSKYVKIDRLYKKRHKVLISALKILRKISTGER
ncbi:glycosyltransferase [Nitratifractor salsuginis]|uniref:Glycosyl transferase family 2 n=1 Tax=Nitratifractor salsuginis (strain DSM 16511 / JCM 12458 / E9I37-1) TaxID=749222 RepID=E6X1A9_NITSE|nr:glycosyltransferase [Nitratifractor salsuginis]ADV46971.1 glycosyl transferase family 2 [Nitratifractor salsuginis DSM 16511]